MQRGQILCYNTTMWIFIAILIFIVLVGALPFLWTWFDVATVGQAGDSFAIITSVITFFALVVLLKTFRLQKGELENAVRFMAEQNETNKKQLTYNLVFQLCEQYREVLKNTHGGKAGLKNVIETTRNVRIYAMSRKDNIINVAEKQFSPYTVCFQLLYHIFKFIEDETYKEKERVKYARIPRAMLSGIELEALLIHCLTKRGKDMKIFVEKYEMFNHYSPNILYDGLWFELMKEYKPEAFGDNPFYAGMMKHQPPPE